MAIFSRAPKPRGWRSQTRTCWSPSVPKLRVWWKLVKNPANAFDAVVRSSSFLGAQTQLELDFGGLGLNLLVPGHYQVEDGETVRAVINAENVLVIVDDDAGDDAVDEDVLS